MHHALAKDDDLVEAGHRERHYTAAAKCNFTRQYVVIGRVARLRGVESGTKRHRDVDGLVLLMILVMPEAFLKVIGLRGQWKKSRSNGGE